MKYWQRLLIAGLGVIALAVALVLTAPRRHDSLAVGTIIYVDADAGSGGSGSSWEDAFTGLQPALDAAAAGDGDEIWVAEGVYYPSAEHGGSGERYRSLQMLNGVGIYGGFDPSVGAIAFEDRDWVLYETVLSGDLNGDDGPDFANRDENSYHVFYHPDGTNLDSSAVLDGFTITGGNADGGSEQENSGGGMYNSYSSPTVSNCTFEGNAAYGYYGGGGGMYNSYSSPTLTNCTFEGNSVYGYGYYGYGGGMYNESSSPTLTNCTFEGNSVREYGGGMYNSHSSSPTLSHCTFSGNTADDAGGGMYNYVSSPTLTDCNFSGNTSYDGGGMYNFHSSPTMTSCSFSGNTATDGGGMYNRSSSPALTNCNFSSNAAVDDGGGMFSYSSSATLTHCTFSTNSAATGSGMYNRGSSSPLLTNCTFEGNSATREGGGMSSADDSSPTLSNCTFSRNSAGNQGGGLFNYESSTPKLTNCTFYGNSALSGGGMSSVDESSPTLINCIFWGDSPDEIVGNPAAVAYSDIQGGYTGEGNINDDPLFADSGNGDFHLTDDSPCIDTGSNDAPDLPPYDFEGDDRIIDGDVDGTSTADMGADEFVPEGLLFVQVDIKPGGDPNSVMCHNEQEIITVAILTSQEFDATTVDHTTVTFEGASEVHVDKKSGEARRHVEDVDKDGDDDLMFHFRLGDTNLTCESTKGMLIGVTIDAQVIVGTDSVRMIDPTLFESPLSHGGP